jgi:hypothetical protein
MPTQGSRDLFALTEKRWPFWGCASGSAFFISRASITATRRGKSITLSRPHRTDQRLGEAADEAK